MSYLSCINTSYHTKIAQVIRDPRSEAGYSEDESDSDSDYEYTLEGTPPSQGDTKFRSDQESEPEPIATNVLSIGAFST